MSNQDSENNRTQTPTDGVRKRPAEAQNGERPVRRPAEMQNGERPVRRPAEMQNGERPVRRPAEMQNGERPVRRPADGTRRRPAEAENGERPVRRPADGARRRPTEAENRERRPAEEGKERRESGSESSGKKTAQRKRDPQKLQFKREQELRKRVFYLAAALIALLLVLLFAVSRSRSGNSDLSPMETNSLKNGAAAGAVKTAQTGDGTVDAVEVPDAALSVVETPPPTPTATPTPTPPPLVTEASISEDGTVHFINDPAYSEKITILGTGDNIIHEALYLDAQTEDGGYDFTPMYARIKKYVQAADIASVSQETPIATYIGSASGYPNFNTPTEAGDALIDCGFDIFNLATNHVYDMGTDGLYATIEYFQNQDKPYFGAFYDSDDRYNIRTVEANGITVAFLGFVNYTNHDGDNASYQLTWFEDYEAVESQITRAKEMADIVVCYVHWGEEYINEVSDTMASAAQHMIDCGADVIFGDHAHILQRLKVVQRKSDGKLVPIQYCGGNLISGQKSRKSLLSVLTTCEFAKNPDTGDVVLTGFKALPIVTHYEGDRNNVSIYPLEDYTEELANMNGVKDLETDDDGEPVGEPMTLDYMWGLVNNEIPEQFIQHVDP